MRRWHMFLAAGAVLVLLLVTACSGTTASNSPSATSRAASGARGASVNTPASAQPLPGSVTPSGPVRVGTWMMTVHSAQAYPNQWNAPAGMPGMWGHMGAGHMAVVLDVSAQNSATPSSNSGGAYAGPHCTLQGGTGMMGPMMGQGYYGGQMMSPGMYRGPMAFMAPTSTRQFTMVCADPTTGNQASWQIGF